jgi:hypothetical protein
VVRIHLVPLLIGVGTPLFAGERGRADPGGEARRGVPLPTCATASRGPDAGRCQGAAVAPGKSGGWLDYVTCWRW